MTNNIFSSPEYKKLINSPLGLHLEAQSKADAIQSFFDLPNGGLNANAVNLDPLTIYDAVMATSSFDIKIDDQNYELTPYRESGSVTTDIETLEDLQTAIVNSLMKAAIHIQNLDTQTEVAMNTNKEQDLEARRRIAVAKIFAKYDFKDGFVTDTEKWEINGDTWSCLITFDGIDGEAFKDTLVVVFNKGIDTAKSITEGRDAC